VFTSDHGECFGAHGRMKKNTFYEEAARVPLLMHWPNGGLTGRACDACITNVDLMPTLLGLTDQPVPPEVEGCDLSQVAAGAAGPEPPFAFLQNTGACAAWEDGHEWRAVRTKQYTYAMYKVDGTELLFDNLADPYQLHNLAADPAMSAVRDSLRNAMQTKMATLNDTFEVSSYYKEHWVDKNRCIIQTATTPDTCSETTDAQNFNTGLLRLLMKNTIRRPIWFLYCLGVVAYAVRFHLFAKTDKGIEGGGRFALGAFMVLIIMIIATLCKWIADHLFIECDEDEPPSTH
jgi:hypothetical protein